MDVLVGVDAQEHGLVQQDLSGPLRGGRAFRRRPDRTIDDPGLLQAPTGTHLAEEHRFRPSVTPGSVLSSTVGPSRFSDYGETPPPRGGTADRTLLRRHGPVAADIGATPRPSMVGGVETKSLFTVRRSADTTGTARVLR